MRQLNGVYTQRFNARHHRCGHVFQRRYKAILVEKDSYLLELTRYVEVLNPVRARMVTDPAEWRWSSYLATIGIYEAEDWLSVEWLLAQFGKKPKAAIRQYVEFVLAGMLSPYSPPWNELKSQIYLGSEAFVENMMNKVEKECELSEVPASQRRPMPKSLSSYEKEACSRNTAIVKAFESGGYSMAAIANYFGVHYTTVSRIVRGTGE